MTEDEAEKMCNDLARDRLSCAGLPNDLLHVELYLLGCHEEMTVAGFEHSWLGMAAFLRKNFGM